MYKKFFIRCLVLFGILLCIIVVLTYIVDPLFQYHKPFFHINIRNERYQNPGILKNFDYDSVLTGSSMVENFRVSWFEDEVKDEKLVKTTFSGGYSKDFNNVFKLAFNTHKIKTVYYGMDVFNIFTHKSDEIRTDIPDYLYDDNLLNDVKYFFNKDILFDYTLYNLCTPNKNNDYAYCWYNRYTFSKSTVLKSYSRASLSKEKTEYDKYVQDYEKNLKNITEYIERYPDTKFKIFMPPYSILFWDNGIRTGTIDAQMQLMQKVMEALLKYDNVEIYYFQNMEDVITNLNNYKDYTHYSEKINYYMFECMCKTNEHLLNKDNYLEEIEKMKQIVYNYNYESIFK